MTRFMTRALGAFALLAIAAPAFAQTPVGCWATVDDEDGSVKSYVKVYQEGNTLVGDIVRLTVNGGRCVDCAERYNGRVLRNERIMSGFRLDDGRYRRQHHRPEVGPDLQRDHEPRRGQLGPALPAWVRRHPGARALADVAPSGRLQLQLTRPGGRLAC